MQNDYTSMTSIPSLLTGLFTSATTAKFDHILTGRTLAAIWRLTHLKDTNGMIPVFSFTISIHLFMRILGCRV